MKDQETEQSALCSDMGASSPTMGGQEKEKNI
jgi:hypothetical protein